MAKGDGRDRRNVPVLISSQPFEFVVVDNMEILKKMASYGMHVLKKAPMAIVLVQKEVLKRRDMGITFLVSQDMGVCIENILLQAYEEGLSAAWVAVGPNSDAQRLLSELLHLPDYVKAHSVVAVGYSAKIVEDESIDRFDESRIHYPRLFTAMP